MNNKLLAGYSVGSLGTGIFSSTPSILLLYYMTDILGVPVSLAALAIFIPKLWDMISDPLVGFYSDKTKSRWGRRRPYLFVGSLLMPIFFIFIFTVPDFTNPLHSFFYVLGAFLLSATTYTIFAVPYMAMPSEMSNDSAERTRIIASRMTLALLGILCGAAIAPVIVDYFGGGKFGYVCMAITLGIICFLSMFITSMSARNTPLIEAKIDNSSLKEQFLQALTNKPFLVLLCSYLFQLIGIGIFTSLMPYFVVYIMQESQSHIGFLFLLVLGSAIISMSVWSMISRRYGKILPYILAIVVYGTSLVSLFFQHTSLAPEISMIFLGVGYAGLQVLPFSLLTDVIRYDTSLAGYSREGVLTGIWTACEKTGLAVGPLIAGNVLAFSGFQESAGQHHTVIQSDTALQGILVGISVVPALFVFISLVAVQRMKIPNTV